MIFYNCEVTFDCSLDADSDLFEDKRPQFLRSVRNPNRFWSPDTIQEFNNSLNSTEAEKVAILIYEAKNTEFGLIVASDMMERLTASRFLIFFKHYLKEEISEYTIHNLKVKALKEITPFQASKLIAVAERNRYSSFEADWMRQGIFGNDNFSLAYFRNGDFNVQDLLIEEKSLTYRSALAQAKKLMLDQSFIDELKRIYTAEHPNFFVGLPIHYALKVKNSQGIKPAIQLLCRALYTNHRIIGRTINRINEISERAHHDCDIDAVFEQSTGNTVIIEMRGSTEDHMDYASGYHMVVNEFSSQIKRHQHQTLFILVEESDNPGFAPKLIGSVQDDMHLVEIKEGAGNRAVALAYLKKLAEEGNLIAYSDEDFERALGTDSTFRPSDINRIYETLRRDNLRNNIYTAYKDVGQFKIDAGKISANDAYTTFQEMIGLTEVKKLLEQIVDNFKIQKARSSMGLSKQRMSMHMVFTGNPGTAKTTVSRLLAQILSKEGILDTGNYVECGRADLIGEYVGQTAPKVRQRFREAKGGVLMIDEAYSLVDHWKGAYGDEALSTIVQEMENNRDDTIVIFCGYPDKMKDFIERNEGLRSRIAFQIDFPDYKADELVEILKLFVKNDGYEISPEIESKCREIFVKAVQKKDFGNGRFVRNLWEQAKLKQSSRLCAENSGLKISREEIITLKPEDFDVNIAEKFSSRGNAIGFAR